MDVARRDWSDEMLAACGLSRDNMPALFEGCEVTGSLRPAVAQAWNMPEILVVAGGGDQRGGSGCVGMADAGQAMLSLGPQASTLPSATAFLANRKAPFTASATRCPGAGI
ncbi:Xylulose kinase [Klebsiella grimontii]|nr:Xylulose kinase [Klebsiella grimontii]